MASLERTVASLGRCSGDLELGNDPHSPDLSLGPHGSIEADNPSNGPRAHDEASRILHSIDAVPYEWRLDSDLLLWGDDAGRVLGIGDPASLRSGTSFALLVEAGSGTTRSEVVSFAPAAPIQATVSPTSCNTPFAPPSQAISACGSRIAAAGLPARTASPRTPTASCV